MLGDALIAAFDWSWPRLSPSIRSFLEELAKSVVPDPPMTVRTMDGESVSGILVVDRGRVLAFVGTRQAVPSSFPRGRPRGDDDWDGRDPGFR